ncbi:MAG: NADH:ubiquinone oxidoreductase, NADH-binding (51 kD) subunit [Nocardia sp.]|uniref:NADH-ubiquinone oxidoreductase-F iron-sulfur binding region domain-containing protein n=1 Tax=Nocardia sp. TaxID=1821 RepID=UPI00263792C3|nr:NADH-ubiquinone oxidoreductase-F iron-sulfur binding region domain-containing protein [Nocardia sp.]MCU1645712.1 NADH:ubiquinone oxidoreductase, NADH-binding (51 kD) subunit [Nocardia sp.]
MNSARTAAPPRGVRRLLVAASPDLNAHLAAYGPLPAGQAATLIDTVAAAGLRGRGGAAFPTARKLAAVAAGSRPIVIANGAEGEPESSKDAVLLTRAPHLVLDGLAAAADAVGARECHLYAPEPALVSVRRALAERRAAGYDRHRVELTTAAGHFLDGEKTAVINRIAGRAALPSDHMVSTSRAGLRGRPTLVHNIETLAHIALIARYGARWFREIGTADEPGSMLVTLSGAGVLEVPLGMPLLDLIAYAGYTDPITVRAVLIGGYHGAWIPAGALRGTTLSAAALRPLHASPGAGIIRVLPTTECGLRVAAEITSYLADQSAGQCGPCRFGLPALATTLADLAAGRPTDVHEIARLAGLVDGRGACHHPDGTARFVRSTLAVFADDVRAHQHGTCRIAYAATRILVPR